MRAKWQRIGSWAAFAAVLFASRAQAGTPLDCTPTIPALPSRNLVSLHTNLGVIRLELLEEPDETPETVANFVNYVERGDYDGSFFHRLIPGFVLQGGGFTYDAVNRYQAVEKDPPVANDYHYCNVRGTVAMAKAPGDPNSATSEFFINLVDNTATLGTIQNGGFTVFARVVPADLPIVDAIGALHREAGQVMIDDPLAAIFTSLPVKHILPREPGGFGCLLTVDPDPDPVSGNPTFTHNCPDFASLNASVMLWTEGMDPRVPPELVMVTEVVVPEPGAVALLATGVATCTVLRLARRRRDRA